MNIEMKNKLDVVKREKDAIVPKFMYGVINGSKPEDNDILSQRFTITTPDGSVIEDCEFMGFAKDNTIAIFNLKIGNNRSTETIRVPAVNIIDKTSSIALYPNPQLRCVNKFAVSTTKYSLNLDFFEPDRSYLFSYKYDYGNMVYKCVNIDSIVCETSDCQDMIYTKDGMKILAGEIFFNHNIVKIGKIPLE